MTRNRLPCLLFCLVLIPVLFSGCAVKRDAYDVPVVPMPDSFQRAPADPAAPSGDQTTGSDEAPGQRAEPIEASDDRVG